ncbi:hypothetical protein [Nocardiopsis sp. LOL_012]|uniref:hypothetical protein n=1 Tax=Nocardiopsis sp. LOL_012 TaxID=3345409 RepID=UPI003A8C64E5
MNKKEVFLEFLKELTGSGFTVEYGVGQPGILLHRFYEDHFDPPLMLHLDPESLHEHVRRMQEGNGPPDSVSEALTLLSVHVQESVDTRSVDRRHLFARPGGVTARHDPDQEGPPWEQR